MMHGEHMRAGRALLKWSAKDLAHKAGVSLSTVQRAEQSDGPVTMIPANLEAIRRAFTAAGISFGTTESGGVSVQWDRS